MVCGLHQGIKSKDPSFLSGMLQDYINIIEFVDP